MIVEVREYVFTIRFSPLLVISTTCLYRLFAMNGPFLIDRDTLRPPYFLRSLTMKRLVVLRFLYPFVGWPQGVTGWRPPLVFPSPPPCGWSTGFIAVPRTFGRLPSHRLRPALPRETFMWSLFPSSPTVA